MQQGAAAPHDGASATLCASAARVTRQVSWPSRIRRAIDAGDIDGAYASLVQLLTLNSAGPTAGTEGGRKGRVVATDAVQAPGAAAAARRDASPEVAPITRPAYEGPDAGSALARGAVTAVHHQGAASSALTSARFSNGPLPRPAAASSRPTALTSVRLCNQVLRALGDGARIDSALHVYDLMVERGGLVAPTAVTYATLISRLGREVRRRGRAPRYVRLSGGLGGLGRGSGGGGGAHVGSVDGRTVGRSGGREKVWAVSATAAAASATFPPDALLADGNGSLPRRGLSLSAALDGLYDDVAASPTVQPDAILLNTLISAAPSIARALAVYRAFKRYRLAPDRWTFNALVAAAARDVSAHLSVAFAVRNTMRAAGFPPDAFTYSALVDACAQRGDVAAAFTVVADMRAARVAPNAHTMGSLVFACGSAGDVARARSVLVGMPPATRSVHAYTAVIDAAAKRGRLDVAFDVFRDMHAVGIPANAHTYSTLIDGCCKARAFVAVADLFAHMRTAGLRPDVTSYTSLLKALADGFPSSIALPPSAAVPGDSGDECLTSNVEPIISESTLMTLSGATVAVGVSGDPAALYSPKIICPAVQCPDVRSASPQMPFPSRDAARAAAGNPVPTLTAAIAPLISPLPEASAGHQGISTRAVGEDRLLRVFLCFADMRAAGVEPDRVTYNVLLNACAGARAGPERAVAIFDAMVAEGISPDVISYTSLIKAICASASSAVGAPVSSSSPGAATTAASTVCATKSRTDTAPCAKTLGAIPSHLDVALGVLSDMQAAGVQPGELAYAALVEGLAHAGRVEDGVKLLTAMDRLTGEKGVLAIQTGGSAMGAAPVADPLARPWKGRPTTGAGSSSRHKLSAKARSRAALSGLSASNLPAHSPCPNSPGPPPSMAAASAASAAAALLRAAIAAGDRPIAETVASVMARRKMPVLAATGRALAALRRIL